MATMSKSVKEELLQPTEQADDPGALVNLVRQRSPYAVQRQTREQDERQARLRLASVDEGTPSGERTIAPMAGAAGSRNPRGSPKAPKQSALQRLKPFAFIAGLLPWMLVAAVVAIPILVFLFVGPKLLAPNNRPPVAVSTSSEPVVTAPSTPRKTARIAPAEPSDMPATDGGLSQPEPSAAEQPQEPTTGVVVTQSILPPNEDDTSTVTPPSTPAPNTA